MKKQTFTKQAVWQAAAVGVLAVGGVLCLSGQIGIGQTYRQVRVDDRIIGYAPENTDMDDIVRQARQELTQRPGRESAAKSYGAVRSVENRSRSCCRRMN